MSRAGIHTQMRALAFAVLAGIAVIGVIGLGLEKLVFQPLERYTVVRWGMVAA
jgi:HAMP domain-containing protein